MFGRSPPNILATLVFCFIIFLNIDKSPTLAKPYPQQNLRRRDTAGNIRAFDEGKWSELINYENGYHKKRDKRSPMEIEDETSNIEGKKTVSVNADKRQGIETPILPLVSDLNTDALSHLNNEESVRSKVGQPENESVGISVEEARKATENTATVATNARHQQETTEGQTVLNSEESKVNGQDTNQEERTGHAPSIGEVKTKTTTFNLLEAEGNQANQQGKTDSTTETKSANGDSKADAGSPLDFNADTRSFEQGVNQISKLANIPNDTISSKPLSSLLSAVTSQDNSDITGTNTHSQESKTAIKENVNKQQVEQTSKMANPPTTPATPTTTAVVQSTSAPLKTTEQPAIAQPQAPLQEKAPISMVPQMQSLPVVPVRDTLGNSGSEIATTHSGPEMYSYTERDTEPKPSNGPEVGHFQVDDKSADLEINANSAGVKVKAKPASLQVVSRPGSHPPPPVLPIAQERSLYRHYRYPPYHHPHHWFPGIRRSYDHFHRRHFSHPYRSFAERRRFEPFYDEPPFFNGRYWYPRRHRHRYHDSDLFERSRMEEPEEYPKYRHGRRHKRRFRHMNGPPFRRQYFNNIPIMSSLGSSQMGMLPEEGTVPQLPIGAGQQSFVQRQNIVTPMPPPVNVIGNPPPGLLNGLNAANVGMNGLGGLNAFNGMNEMNEINGVNGINRLNGVNGMNEMNGVNDINGMNAMGVNPLGQTVGMEGLGGELNGGFGGLGALGMGPGATRALGTRNVNPTSEAPRRAFKKTAIISGRKAPRRKDKKHLHNPKVEAKKNVSNDEHERPQGVESNKKETVNLKSWEKTLKRYHRLNVFTSKSHESHQYRRSTNTTSKKSETKKSLKRKEHRLVVHDLHPQHDKDAKANRKNAIVMHRPPIIYHPPPEIYHRPDIVVHRAPIMLHRPPIVYHQPPVVVHRPAIIYHQPPIVFHQPPPMVHQPVLHSHDTWVTKPVVYHTASMVSHAKTFYGIPSHVFSGNYGDGCHGPHCSYRKGGVPHNNDTFSNRIPASERNAKPKTKRHSSRKYPGQFNYLWNHSGRTKRDTENEYNYITSTEGAKQELSYTEIDSGEISRRNTIPNYNDYLYNQWSSKFKRAARGENKDGTRNGFQKKKKKDVVVNRPPIIYHPPPEIYHRPDIVVHRPPLVIHRPPIIYHQPPVIVHRPAVVYHQPPIVFHQPPPAVSQPLLYSHDSFTVHPAFFASHHGSIVRDFGHYVGVPNVITNFGTPLFGKGPQLRKRSKIASPLLNTNSTSPKSDSANGSYSSRVHSHKAMNATNEKAGKKNTVVVTRPPIIYHPPPEIYHRPIIVVHRPPIMIHRAPIMYHQPPVVVHRPAIVYHQPPLVFHQPPPMVHQPILNSRDTWVSHHVVVPFGSRVTQHHTYVGVPDAYTIHHYTGGHGTSYSKSHILKTTKSDVENATQRNEIFGVKNTTVTEKDATKKHQKNHNVKESLKIKKTANRKGGKKNAVIVRRPPIVYHPPPEIYHRPEIIVHRAPIMIHRAPIIYHQPPVIVHRPAIVYHQPALIFHQPMPVVHQPVYKSHDTYVPRPAVRLFRSRLHHAGHILHIPHAYYHRHGGLHYLAFGKSKVPQKERFNEQQADTRGTINGSHSKSDKDFTGKNRHIKRKHLALTKSKDKTETGTKLHKNQNQTTHHRVVYHKATEVTERANKKNSVVIHRPPIIYHPPPEIYHRPDIVVHRAPIVLYRAPIVYHQPPVVVHRPAIVYHQPPIVFHQPPPMVHQPVLHSHDTWVTKSVAIPYASNVHHVATYKGVPHEEIFMHGIGMGAFGKSRFLFKGARRNKIDQTRRPEQVNSKKSQTVSQGTQHRTTRDTDYPWVSDYGYVTHALETPHAGGDIQPGAGQRIIRALGDQWNLGQPECLDTKGPIGAGARIQRSILMASPYHATHIEGVYQEDSSSYSPNHDETFEQPVGALTRIQRSLDTGLRRYMTSEGNSRDFDIVEGAESRIKRYLEDPSSFYLQELQELSDFPMGARSRIQRAVAESWATFQGEEQSEIYKRSSEESQHPPTADENADKSVNSTKKTLLIIRRPPILYHPPSHMIHRPSIVVHRPDIVVHRHPIVFHRPPILVHRPPIIIHRAPVLVRRPPIIVHRPPLVFHRPPLIIHRRPYIVHHHPILFHRPPIIIHKGPQMIVHHSHLIHHYPMHMIHMRCPGCGFGKSTVARVQPNATEQDFKTRSDRDRYFKDKEIHQVKKAFPNDATAHDSKGKGSNKPKRSVAETRKTKKSNTGAEHHTRHKGTHKKKKDVVVSRPPIIYHPPPEVYHRPDIVVHRAPILIHRPPIVYHQPPVVVHRPAVVYHQPPIVFHQPAPAVNQPLLYSHDSFVVHPMAFATHMGSIVNEAGHYVGLPHGGVSNFPGGVPHGTPGHIFPTMAQSNWARRTEVEKPKKEKHAKQDEPSRKKENKRSKGGAEEKGNKSERKNNRPSEQKAKQTKGERKNKVIVARPPMIYHPPPEIYDRPDIIIHRPDIVIHRPSVVYHQPSVVIHRAPVVYQQPPVVFHQPPPMVSQTVYNAHDTYVANPVFHPHASHTSHSSTYVGAPQFYPGKNDYGWGLSGHWPTSRGIQAGSTTGFSFPISDGYTQSSAYGSNRVFGQAFGRSEVAKGVTKSPKNKDKALKAKVVKQDKINGDNRTIRSTETNKRHIIHHHHHHHRHHHPHHHHHNLHHHHRHHIIYGHYHRLGHHRGYKLRPLSSFTHLGHRKHLVIIHRPPLIYHPPPQVYHQPDILMHLPPIVYHRPPLMFQQPPTIVHHPPIIYHQPPVVFHNPPPIVHTAMIHQRELITPRVQHIMLPTSSYVRPAGRYFGTVLPGQAYGKSLIERTEPGGVASETVHKYDSETTEKNGIEKDKKKRETSNLQEKKGTPLNTDGTGSKRQNVGVVVHQPPIVYHPPPDIFDKPPLVVRRPPMIVRRPPILIHRAPVVVHRAPIIIHRPPVILHHPTPVYHVPHGHLFHPVRFAFGKSTVIENKQKRSEEVRNNISNNSSKKHKTRPQKELKKIKKGQRKNVVFVQRSPMIYHPPVEIYHRPNVIVHRPDIVIHRPSIVYHQPLVVVHRPAVIYRQPPIVFHQPSPMVHQPIVHAHDTYIAKAVPVPYFSHVYRGGTYVGAPHYFHGSRTAFGKSRVENTKETKSTQKKAVHNDKNSKPNRRQIRDASKGQDKNSRELKSSTKGDKKNKVVILRPPMIYHPPPEIYERPSIIVHRPDIVIHRPSVVYHQPSVVVHRPSVIYHQPAVIFHQPPPLVHQRILHAHDTYLAHPVPIPYSSHVRHAATYIGSPHHYPGGWNYGWHDAHWPGDAYGKSNVPKSLSDASKSPQLKPAKVRKVRREIGKERNLNNTKDGKTSLSASHKKNQVIIHRPALVYHPPPEIYHKPDVIMHRPDIVIHRPSVVYHQPAVVVHRPPVIYRQPPVVFHQPPPMVRQPIFHRHDTYFAHPHFVPYTSRVHHVGTYVGAPQFYPGGWGWGRQAYGFGHAFGKSKVAKASRKHNKKDRDERKGRRRTLEKAKNNSLLKETSYKKQNNSANGLKKNVVVMKRPPIIYHPPPEIYERPNIIMHRPDIVIHRPSVVYHQPSVVVHRPPIIYRQPPVVFHQPPPMIKQPIFHTHDTYVSSPHFVPYKSHVHHASTYVGAPQFYPGGWGWKHHGYGHVYGKSKIESSFKQQKKNNTSKNQEDSDVKGNRRTLQKADKNVPKRKKSKEEGNQIHKGQKKNLVIMRRPPLIYHPPPEVYHRPDVIVHRPDLVIHRPSVVFHQPSVVVHRPPVIYQQPPVVFHQPPPMVRQPIIHAHDTYLAHPHFVPYMSHLHHAGSYVGAPNFFPGGWHWGRKHAYRNAFGKSKVQKPSKTPKKHKDFIEKGSIDKKATRRTLHDVKKSLLNGTSENATDSQSKGHKKNLVIIRRPPMIYHPPAEIYHRPDVIVHRPDVVIHRPSVVFHQPSVMVHRPPVIYHQPPVVFHQPPPMVHQPIFHSHETYVQHPHFVPYISHITHAGSYVGAPHFYGRHWANAFGKSKVEKGSKNETSKETGKKSHTNTKRAARELHNVNKKSTKETNTKHLLSKSHRFHKDHSKPGHPKRSKAHKKNTVVVRRPTLVYHPPSEIYDRPAIIVHRPDFVIHQPSVVYHQPSVVVHRPPIIYHPPPVVFHQPPPKIHQPMVTSRDIYHAHPYFVPYKSILKHAHTYVGAPNFYPGGWGYGYGFSDHPFNHHWGTRGWNDWKTDFGPPMWSSTFPSRNAFHHSNSYAFTKSHVQRHMDKKQLEKAAKETVGSSDKPRHHKNSEHSATDTTKRSPKESHQKDKTVSRSLKKRAHKKGHNGQQGGKKNIVVMKRPPLIYHPPPEIYHRPNVIQHRPDIVIHQPSVVYHQPSVMVHRPPVIYHQAPVVFHQPPPMVRQPIYNVHEHYLAQPNFVPYASQVKHTGTYVGAPTFFHGGWNYGYGHAYGKSDVQKHHTKHKARHNKFFKKDKIESGQKGKNTREKVLHPEEEKDENASRKNDIVVSRPPIIYHPPPEIYHRPDIVVHRAPIVLHRPPIIYHQPPVVVHRPAVVYHQPPIVFHQPPPTVTQPILHSHDSFVVRPAAKFYPQGSTVTHSMNYVGVPNHIVHGDELSFGHFHRSKIEHSNNGKNSKKSLAPHVTKSTISKNPTTNKENTETTITDQTQKKTFRSNIFRGQLNKRQLAGSQFYGPVSPINDIHYLPISIEQKEKLSTIPGQNSHRQREIAKRSDELSRDTFKRQVIIPESSQYGYPNSLPSVYNTLEMAALQNQALAAPTGLPSTEAMDETTLAGIRSALPVLPRNEKAEIERLPVQLPLQQLFTMSPKEESPDVRVHVETAKSSIPLTKGKPRQRRQILPLYPQQVLNPVTRVLYQPPTDLRDIGIVHASQSPSQFPLLSPYPATYHPISDALHYLPTLSQLHHRPHVNINVQSARSSIPDPPHQLDKRSGERKSKRQLLSIVPPFSPSFPLSPETEMKNYFIYPPISQSMYLRQVSSPTPQQLSYPLEPESEGHIYPDALHLYHQPLQYLHKPYNILPEDEDNDVSGLNPWAQYLGSLYANNFGFPFYHRQQKPKVNIEVHASKSHIPMASEMKHNPGHSRVVKRQLYNYYQISPLAANHYALPTALTDYGIRGVPSSFHHNSPHVNINVETTKKSSIPSSLKQRRSLKKSRRRRPKKQGRKDDQTGEKRDELGEGFIANGQDQANAQFVNAPENQFVATAEAVHPERNEIEQLQAREEMLQQIPSQGIPEQQQTAEEEQMQQTTPLQSQETLVPFQTPMQMPTPMAYQTPYVMHSQAPLMVPFQGEAHHTIETMSEVPGNEQITPHEPLQIEDGQQHHTSININLAEKSTVPKRKVKGKGGRRRKRQFLPVPQSYMPMYLTPNQEAGPSLSYNRHPQVSINVQTSKKSTLERAAPIKFKGKRQAISLLSRFPAEQVLPQTFLQNGVLMPAFNTLPVNHRIKSNGMLLQELSQQKKNLIFKKKQDANSEGKREQTEKLKINSTVNRNKQNNSKRRHFYVLPQPHSALSVQQQPILPQEPHSRPGVSEKVIPDKRKSSFLIQEKDQKTKDERVKGQLHQIVAKHERKDKVNMRRQVYGIEDLPHLIHLPVIDRPLMSKIPIQRHNHVSVPVDTTKKDSLANIKAKARQPRTKHRRQIYGLSQLPHEGVLAPFSIAGQGLALGYLPSNIHKPRVSVNVEASKRSEDDDDDLTNEKRKRQVLGFPVPYNAVGEESLPIAPQEAFQPDMNHMLPARFYPTDDTIHVQEGNHHGQEIWPASAHATPLIQEQQHVADISRIAPSTMAVHEERPHVSVHVEASKRGDSTGQNTKNHSALKLQNTSSEMKRQVQEDYDLPSDYEEATVQQQGLLQDSKPRVSVNVEVAKKKGHIHSSKYHKRRPQFNVKNNAKGKRQFISLNNRLGAESTNPGQGKQFANIQNQEQPVLVDQRVPHGEIVVNGEQTQRADHPVAYIPVAHQQIVPFLPVGQVQSQPAGGLPVENEDEQGNNPKVSIRIQTARSAITTHETNGKSSGRKTNSKHIETPKRSRRQMFGTVPLLSPLGQPAVPENSNLREKDRSTLPRPVQLQDKNKRQVTEHSNISHSNKNKNSWKRQFLNYPGSQEVETVFPNQQVVGKTAVDEQQEQQIGEEQQEQQTEEEQRPTADVKHFQQEAAGQLMSSQVAYQPTFFSRAANQVPPQPYVDQMKVPEDYSPIQLPQGTVNPFNTVQDHNVNINVQTAKSRVPSARDKERKFKRWLTRTSTRKQSPKWKVEEKKKVKRQFSLLGDDVIERRRGPKYLGGPLKKERQNLFRLENNLNKPVEVFSTDPVADLVRGGDGRRRRPRLGGIRLESPTGAGAIPIKETSSLSEALGSVLNNPAVFQDNAADAIAPLAQEPALNAGDPFPHPRGLMGIAAGIPNNLPIADLPPRRASIFPLPATNQAFFPNMDLPAAVPLKERSVLIAPQIIPIGPMLPLPPPMVVPPAARETTPQLPQFGPFMPPVLPMALPVPLPRSSLPPAENPPVDQEPDEDKPSVHVNVETTRSNVPKAEQSTMHQTKGPA